MQFGGLGCQVPFFLVLQIRVSKAPYYKMLWHSTQ
jgi:hypothetical protein